MHSQVGIIVGAVASALFGLYVFVPDGGLRTFDDGLGRWQPMVWNAPAVAHSTSSEQKEESQFPLHPCYEEEVTDENQFQFIGHEDIMKRLQALSDLYGPEIWPLIPPQVPLSRVLQFHQAVVEILSILWPQVIIYLLPYLLDIVLAQKTCVLRKLQKLYKAEKHKNVELLAGQKSKESLDKEKIRDEDEEKRPTTSEQSEQERTETLDDARVNEDWVREIIVEGLRELLDDANASDDRVRAIVVEGLSELLGDAKANDERVRQIMVEGPSEHLGDAKANDEPVRQIMVEGPSELLGDAKANDDRVKEIRVEGPSELPDSEGLPEKRRRPGRRNSKRDHKLEAEKRKRKQAEKKAALAGVAEGSP